MLVQLMLAQCQGCIYEAMKSKPHATRAALAEGAATLFKDVVVACKKSAAIKEWLSNSGYGYATHMLHRQLMYQAVAQFHLAKVQEAVVDAGVHYGREIGHLLMANKYMAEAQALEAKEPPLANGSLNMRKHWSGEIGPRLQDALKDNETVYFSTVPRPDELDPSEPNVLAKPVPFVLPAEAPVDPFSHLVR